MSDDKLLKKIEEIVAANNKTLLTGMDKKIIINNKILLDDVDKRIEKTIAANNKVLLDDVDKRIEKTIIENNAVMLNAMDKKIQASAERTKMELCEKIEDSQKDTIEVLSALIHTGYDMHEERIQRIETTLDLPPLKQN